MQSKSAAWWTALQSASVEWRYGLDILDEDEFTPLEDPTAYDMSAQDRLVDATGSISVDVTAKSQRTFTLQLRNSDGRYIPGPAGYPSGGAGSPVAQGLIWYNARFRPWIDMRVGFDATGKKVWDRTYLGMFVLAQPQMQTQDVGSQAALNLIDKSALLCKPNLITDATLPTFTKNGHTVGGYASGSTVDAAMIDLATSAGIPVGKQHFEPSSATLPADYAISEGTEWWEHLQALAGSIAHVLYFDSQGNLVRQSDPTLGNAPSVFTFAPGPLSITTTNTRTTDLSNTYNSVIVIGASTTTATVRGTASVTDPGNPYHADTIGTRVVYIGKDGKLDDMTPDPMIGTTGAANTVAGVALARHVGQQELITLRCRNIPALEPYDRVTVNIPQSGLNLDMLVTQMTWNLAHDQMEVDGARWFAVGL